MASKRTADKQHRWLSQVEVTGVVFSEPVLAEAAPAGFPNLDKKVLAQFHKAREIWNLPKGMIKENPQGAWIRFILEEILRHRPTDWLVGAAVPADNVVNLPAQQETIRPTRVLVDGNTAVLLMLEVPRTQSLDRPWMQGNSRWKASPTTKLERLLRETGLELGLVTNGEAWRLVAASPAETASWITWTATTWAESPLTLAAFRDLLGSERFFAGSLAGVPLELIRRSRERQLDVADQLGEQARDALSLFIRALDDVDLGTAEGFLGGYSDREVFDTGVAFVMRLLFLLFAEENALLPHGAVAYDRAYGVLHLLTELEKQHRLSPEKLAHSFSAYARLLATSRLIHDGSVDPDIRIAAHGGRLFDPAQYPLLEGRDNEGEWLWTPPSPPRVSDAVIREMLRCLKYAEVGGVRQLVSYRTLAVEQIGHMYEGLLDLRVLRAPAATGVVLLEPSPKEPEPVLTWSSLDGLDDDAAFKLLAKTTKRTKAQISRTVERGRQRDPDKSAGPAFSPGHAVAYLVQPGGVIRPRGRYLGYGEDRHSQGTHYTPVAVTQPMVRRLLEPLVREAVEGETAGPFRHPKHLLSLRVCDPAAGSGAFLVQSARFISEALVESWEAEEARRPDDVLALPYASTAAGDPEEVLMPSNRAEKELWARRYVVEHCIYGVDINPLAVEMAKLSLWLIALSKDKPFTFLDHAIRAGNSVIGVGADQLRSWSVDPRTKQQAVFAQKAGEAARRAAELRRRVWQLPPAAAEREKAAALEASATATHPAHAAADLLVSAWIGSGERDDALHQQSRDELLINGATSVEDWCAIATTAESRLDGEQPFHWGIEFPEVFEKAGGFDAVVGNPPYVRHELLADVKRYLAEAFEVYVGTADLYTYFYELALRLVRPGGRLSMIVTNKWMRASYGEQVRTFLAERAWIDSLVDFGHAKQIFRGVDVFPCILTARKPDGTSPPTRTEVCVIERKDLRLQDIYGQIAESSYSVDRTRFDGKPWQLEHPDVMKLFRKLAGTGTSLCEYVGSNPLYGIKTGFNQAFIIDSETREQIVSRDPAASAVVRRMVRGRDLERWRPAWGGEWLVTLASSANKKWPWSEKTAESDAENKFAESYPGLYEYMKPMEEKLRKRSDRGRFWWELRSCDYYDAFDAPKIIYQEIQFHPRFAFDEEGLLGQNGTFILPNSDLYLLGTLNSPVMWWFSWRHLAHMKDETLNTSAARFRSLPIAVPLESTRSKIEANVRQILLRTSDEQGELQALLGKLIDNEIVPAHTSPAVLNIEQDERAFLKGLVKIRGAQLTPDQQRQALLHWRVMVPVVTNLGHEITQCESIISDWVFDAYSLSADERALLWSTAPPRTPLKS